MNKRYTPKNTSHPNRLTEERVSRGLKKLAQPAGNLPPNMKVIPINDDLMIFLYFIARGGAIDLAGHEEPGKRWAMDSNAHILRDFFKRQVKIFNPKHAGKEIDINSAAVFKILNS